MLGTHIGFEQGMTFRGNLSLVFKVIATPFHTYYQRGGIKSGTRNGLSVICCTSLTEDFLVGKIQYLLKPQILLCDSNYPKTIQID